MDARYARNHPKTHGIIREKDSNQGWIYRLSPTQHPVIALEEEIWKLRLRMEQMYLIEQSFTSPSVMEISEQLDKKINEYLQRNK